MTRASEPNAYDQVIIGAGEAGQAAAHLARKLGGTVASIDRELVRRLMSLLGLHAVEGAPPCGQHPPRWRQLPVAARLGPRD